jgi:succinoglycan biosynthesis transport protein ExoP
VASRGDGGNYGAQPAQGESRSLLGTLRRRGLVVVLVTLLTGAAAAAIAYVQRDRYESRAKLVFRQTIGAELNAIGLLPASLDADNLANSNVELVDSRRVAAAAARDLRRRGVDVSVDDLQRDIKVSNKKDNDVVEVVARADSARRAGTLADVYAKTAQRIAEDDQKRLAAQALRSVKRRLRQLPRRKRDVGVGARLAGEAERLELLTDVGVGSPEIIDPGYVPTRKSGIPLKTIGLGLLFGLALGLGFALLREQADRRLHRREDISAAFQAPVLTTVPRDRSLKRHEPFPDLPPRVAEAFRMLQVNLHYGEGQRLRVVLVTSARRQEGKTTVAWNLASAAASAGFSVALVEADLRRPILAQRYGLAPQPGLAETLRREVSLSESLQPVVSPGDPLSNGGAGLLYVLVAGQPPPNPWALTQSIFMDQVLQTLRTDHDLVVVDAPPVPYVPDAVSLLRRVDGVIVSASVGSTRGPDAARLRDQLEALDTRIVGVVANRGSAADGYYAYSPPGPPTSPTATLAEVPVGAPQETTRTGPSVSRR